MSGTESADSAPQGFRLPEIHDAANRVSLRGQKVYVRLSATRLVSLAVAAVIGALALGYRSFDVSGLVILAAFSIAAFAEFALIYFQPERDWYAGRAVAESTKTLAWRFAVQGSPFGPDLSEQEAEDLLQSRVVDVLDRGRDRIDLGPGEAVITAGMRALRDEAFSVRRDAYIRGRTEEQRKWYSTKARENQTRATSWRYILLVGELLAVVLAALSFGREEPFDFAGILAAGVACGAAWLAIKQHSQLTSAYRVAAIELAVQEGVLSEVTPTNWARAVGDAEEAISREHTMWLATRGRGAS